MTTATVTELPPQIGAEAMAGSAKERWASGDLYEPYVGRWSRLVARDFLKWLDAPAGLDWLDVGCGTGALAEAIGDGFAPNRLAGIDPSAGFLGFARERLGAARAELRQADAQELPFAAAEFDRVVSGLVLNFVADQARMVAEMARVARPGGEVGLYVWDYAGKMEMMRRFWDAAVALDAGAGALDEGVRFPVCRPEPLTVSSRLPGSAMCRRGRSTCRRCSATSTTTGRRSSAGRGRRRGIACR